MPPDNWGDTDEALNGPVIAQSTADQALNGPATAHYDLGDIGQRDDDAQSLSNVRSVIDREDVSTQRDDEEMAIQRQPPHTGKDWSKELPLSTEGPVNQSPLLQDQENNTRKRFWWPKIVWDHGPTDCS